MTSDPYLLAAETLADKFMTSVVECGNCHMLTTNPPNVYDVAAVLRELLPGVIITVEVEVDDKQSVLFEEDHASYVTVFEEVNGSFSIMVRNWDKRWQDWDSVRVGSVKDRKVANGVALDIAKDRKLEYRP